MKIFYDSAPRLLHLLLLAELFLCSWSRPAHQVSHCSLFRPMIHQIDKLLNAPEELHGLTEKELINLAGMENTLAALPHIEHTATQVGSLKMNESLSLIYVYAESFRLHVDWLKTAKENLSLPSEAAEGASTHLLQLSNLVKTALQQINQEAPESPPASLPTVSSSFEALKHSIEISERLEMFCHWSKTVLRLLQKRSSCPKH